MLPFASLKIDYRAVTVSVMSNEEVLLAEPDDLGSFHLEDSVEVEAAGCRLLRPVDRDLVVIA